MSVLKSKREVSKTEYLKVLRELEVFIIQHSAKKPRKMDHLFLNDFIQCCKDAYNNAIAAYSVIVSCRHDVELRHRYLMLAYMNIQKVNSQTGIYYDLYKETPNGLSKAEMRDLSGLIFNAALLLQEEIKADKHRFKMFLNDKDESKQEQARD